MKTEIIIFVHTEYHLLLAINQVLQFYNDRSNYIVDLYIRRGRGNRLAQTLDFSHLPLSVFQFEEEISIWHELSDKARVAVESLIKKKPDVFIFFQEQDPLMVILSSNYSRAGTSVYLYQDGLKPYVHLNYHSLGLLKHHHMENLWMRRNGFRVESWLSPVFSKKYAFLKGIKKIYLTFPESYDNWNNIPIEKIEFLPIEILNPVLKRLFNWDDSLLPERENIILFMNQPMHDDGIAETKVLRRLAQRFPDNSIYIKLHPIIEEKKLKQYQTFKNVKIIKSSIPAELFIMNVSRSVILSINSTSMFLYNPLNKFYYLNKMFKGVIGRLKRLEIRKEPAGHITYVESIEEICF